ncbi:MAG: penicillin-binding protein 2 [Gammaproteobacteria bacterium]|nr:penicillin-binding protein 2 [Gammaproteobacteria bacterium]MXW46788.1 penicillin-binding protein 2 [Gammaproteobacteria bacterium]MYD03240.1 penicillin-binding protein 2 [Gammaproteobacteria bacterium]MYI24224.1 penicillin-binding protein 2 [Gammaproteobacteria bacterium]
MATRLEGELVEPGTLVRRAIYMAFLLGVLSLVLLARLSYLQLVQHGYYAGQALGNRAQGRKVPPRRGIILDRNGEVLAANRAGFRLIVVPEQVDDMAGTLGRLANSGILKPENQSELVDILRRSQPFEAVPVRSRLSDEIVARFAVVRHQFTGVDIEGLLLRQYPLGAAGAHALGYVTAVSVEDKVGLEPERYAGISHLGKTGVERSYEDYLRGSAGSEQIVTNAYGRPLSRRRELEPEPGSDLLLAIDRNLQTEAYAAMDSRRGAVVAIDPNGGGVLALVSSPAFDPDDFVVGMGRGAFAELTRNTDRPMFNRAVRGAYPPGSTIKPMLAFTALTTGRRDAGHTIDCRGSFRLPGSRRLFRDWKREGHGAMNLHDAIAQSCDVYFYQLARDMNVEGLNESLVQFGFGAPTGVDLVGEGAGIVPSRAWKRANFSDPAQQPWFPGDTVVAGIGQGYLTVTPLQLAQAAAQLAMRGKRYKPRLVEAIRDPASGSLVRMPPIQTGSLAPQAVEHWNTVVDSMVAVAHGPLGTARTTGGRLDFRIAGKTGTSQVRALPQDGEQVPEEVEERFRDHSLFVAFAPVHDPVIALAVIVENGGSGSGAAAQVASRLLETYLAGNAPPDLVARAQ